MSDDVQVECPIHLDAVSIADILVFKCGHGFCEPCLEALFSHHLPGNRILCPTCRKPVKRKEAFPLFLVSAQPSTQRNHQASSSPHIRAARELREVKAAHANCTERFIRLQEEIDTLRRNDAHHNDMIRHLRDRYDLLQERFLKEEDKCNRAVESGSLMMEEVVKLRVENLKISRALEQALEDVQVQANRVKLFQGYIERYKHKCNLERKKRKAMESADHHPNNRVDDSLMVVDANAPDALRQEGNDFGWLDKACRVKGDQLAIAGDEDLESGDASDGEEVVFDTNGRQRSLEPPPPFRSDWMFGSKPEVGSSGKQSRKVGGSRVVKVKMPAEQKLPFVVDRQGRAKGLVALGSRQKLNSKN